MNAMLRWNHLVKSDKRSLTPWGASYVSLSTPQVCQKALLETRRKTETWSEAEEIAIAVQIVGGWAKSQVKKETALCSKGAGCSRMGLTHYSPQMECDTFLSACDFTTGVHLLSVLLPFLPTQEFSRNPPNPKCFLSCETSLIHVKFT